MVLNRRWLCVCAMVTSETNKYWKKKRMGQIPLWRSIWLFLIRFQIPRKKWAIEWNQGTSIGCDINVVENIQCIHRRSTFLFSDSSENDSKKLSFISRILCHLLEENRKIFRWSQRPVYAKRIHQKSKRIHLSFPSNLKTQFIILAGTVTSDNRHWWRHTIQFILIVGRSHFGRLLVYKT